MFGLFSVRTQVKASSAKAKVSLRVQALEDRWVPDAGFRPSAALPTVALNPALVAAPFDTAAPVKAAAQPIANAQLLPYAKLASAAYDTSVPQGWRATRVVDYSMTTGFKGVLYESIDGRQAVLAFRGTDYDHGNYLSTVDLITDIAQAAGAIPAQYAQAMSMAKWAKRVYGSKLVIVGHSKGGGEATYAGLMTSTRTVVFNAAGLGTGAITDLIQLNKLTAANTALVDNYNLSGDPLSGYVNWLLGTPQVGRQFKLSPTHSVGAMEAHSITTIIDALQHNLRPIAA